MKKFLLLLISIVVAAGCQLSAQEVATSFAGGTGTEDDPYLSHLRYLADRVNYGVTFKNKFIALANDIRDNDYVLNEEGYLIEDVSNLREFPSIGDKNCHFMGTFDGQGHSINGIFNSGWGLFVCPENAKFKNLSIKDSDLPVWLNSEKKTVLENCINYARTCSGFEYGYSGDTELYNCGNYGNCTHDGLGYRGIYKMVNCFNLGKVETDSTYRFQPGYGTWGGAGLVDCAARAYNCFNGGYRGGTSQTAGLIRWLRYSNNEMANCVNYGRVEPFSDKKSGAIISGNGLGSPDVSQLENIYWLETSHAFGVPPQNNSSKLYIKGDYLMMSEDEMKSDEFLEKLNANARALGSQCCGWVRGKDGFPILEIVKDERFAYSTTPEVTFALPESSPRYFTLQGIEVKEPAKGYFIRVTGNKSEVVLIK